ncbi:hypothetical protein F4811DRAFT_574421 [Daldinia bambusicola]|nr:hypothetical protein F4811DRAFT_574421 [Daldinia bambusicola]
MTRTGYIMEFRVSGNSRCFPSTGPIGVAVACLIDKEGKATHTYKNPMGLIDNPANSQRATLSAIILALEKVLELHEELKVHSQLNVSIATDSPSARHCMTYSLKHYFLDGWRNSRGESVVNWDLLARIVTLEKRVRSLGNLAYNYVPEHYNTIARNASEEALENFRLEVLRSLSLAQPASRGSMFEEREENNNSNNNVDNGKHETAVNHVQDTEASASGS